MPRKSKYETHILPNLDKIKYMRQNGATEKEIYKTFKVSEDSFYRYKKEKPELSEVLKESDDFLIGKIKDSVFTAAIGSVKTKSKYKHVNGRKILISTEEETLVANMTAAAMALKILSPEYRDILSNNIQIDNTNVNNAMDNFNSFSEEIAKYLPNDNED